MGETSEWTILLDWDDTLSDSKRRDSRYCSEFARELERRCGGDYDELLRATVYAQMAVQEAYNAAFSEARPTGYCSWIEGVWDLALATIERAVRVRAPDLESLKAARRCALLQCDSVTAETQASVSRLAKTGSKLLIASGQDSEFLEYSARGAGMFEYLSTWYGPDLIDCAKESPEYYRRIVHSECLDAEHSLVVDDLPVALEWAQEAGLRVVRAKVGGPHDNLPGDGRWPSISRYADFATVLELIQSQS